MKHKSWDMKTLIMIKKIKYYRNFKESVYKRKMDEKGFLEFCYDFNDVYWMRSQNKTKIKNTRTYFYVSRTETDLIVNY
jgi:hypothetical protein